MKGTKIDGRNRAERIKDKKESGRDEIATKDEEN